MPSQSDSDDDVIVRVCDCGVIAAGWARARCGRNGQRNMRAECPTRVMRIVAWEDARQDRTPAEIAREGAE